MRSLHQIWQEKKLAVRRLKFFKNRLRNIRMLQLCSDCITHACSWCKIISKDCCSCIGKTGLTHLEWNEQLDRLNDDGDHDLR